MSKRLRPIPGGRGRRLQDFADRIVDCLAKPEPQARKELRTLLARLILAVEEHRRIEELSIGCPPPLGPQKVADLLGLLALQHDSLLSLCKDIRLFLQHPGEYPFHGLASSSRLLARDIRDHLQAEEARLRPFFKRVGPGRKQER